MSDFERDIEKEHPQRQVDLLVDGEMDEADRRALLLQLEHEPDGWRRCAMAFLEAQCWKAELGKMAAAAPGPLGQVEADVPQSQFTANGEQNGRRH